MKYIVIETPIGEMGFTFNDFLVHKIIAENMTCILVVDHKFPVGEVNVVSAGFVDSKGGCYGKSESLELESRIEDDFIITK